LQDYWHHFWHFQRNARLFLVSNWLNGVTVGIFATLYNLYLLAIGYNTAFIGWILLVATAAGGLAIFPAGILVDRAGGKYALLWGSFGAGIAGATQLIFRQPAALLASSAVVGAVAAIFLVVPSPFLANHSCEEERAYLFSLNTALTLVASVIGTILGGFLPGWLQSPLVLHSAIVHWLSIVLAPGSIARSYQLALLTAGILGVPSLIPIFLMTPGPGKEAASVALLSAGSDTVTLPPGSTESATGKHRWYAPLANRVVIHTFLIGPVWQFALIEAFLGLGAGLFIPYFNVYFVQDQGASIALYGIISAGGTILMALATLAAPLLSMYFGKVRAALYTELCSLPFLALLSISSHLPLAIGAYLLRGSLMNMAEPVLNAYMMEAVPARHRGTANSTFNLSFQGPWALGAVAGGQLIALRAYPLTFSIAAILYACSAGLLWWFFARR
jgi:MFS family permease